MRAIVTGGTITTDTRVIEYRGAECRGAMTEITILRGGHMIRLRIFANGIHAVVTTGAVVGHPGVIKRAGGKATGVMTHTTIFAGGYVCCWLTRGV